MTRTPRHRRVLLSLLALAALAATSACQSHDTTTQAAAVTPATPRLTAVTQGIAVQAASGATREDLHRVADQALSTWPSP